MGLFQAKARNIDDAVQVALEFEAFQNGRRKRGNNRPVRRQTETEFDKNESIVHQTMPEMYTCPAKLTILREDLLK